MVCRSKAPAFNQLYFRLSIKESKMKIALACAHKLLRFVYKVLKELSPYDEKKALGLRQQSLVHN